MTAEAVRLAARACDFSTRRLGPRAHDAYGIAATQHRRAQDTRKWRSGAGRRDPATAEWGNVLLRTNPLRIAPASGTKRHRRNRRARSASSPR
ncbi:hypothetical protein OH687_36350 [Burkholderia anthina]|nr:hypothetical protein OH687_36350 [Burkholderia anthina]